MKRSVHVQRLLPRLLFAGLTFGSLSIDTSADWPSRGDGPRRAGLASGSAPAASTPASGAGVGERPAAAATADDDDPMAACVPHETRGDLDEPPLPDDLKSYARRVAERLEAAGTRPLDGAVAAFVDHLAGAPSSLRAAQVGAVARTAILSTDPTLYGSAMLACETMRDGDSYLLGASSCGELHPAQLRLLDPDNGWLWLRYAAEARDRHDTDGESQALYRASVARLFVPPELSALRTVLSALRHDDPPELRYKLLLQLMTIYRLASADGEVREAGWLSDSCQDEALAQPNRLQLCEDIAHNFLDRSTGPQSLWTGITVARALGWSDDRLRPFDRRAWRTYLAKKALPSMVEAACGGSEVGWKIVTALLAPELDESLRAPAASRAVQTMQAHRAKAEAPPNEITDAVGDPEVLQPAEN